MQTDEDLDSFYERLVSYRNADSLPTEEAFSVVVNDVISVLESEDSSYRPSDDEEMPGGLLDFKDSDIPVILVPDLHARPDFLLHLLKNGFGEDGETVLSALAKGHVMIVCVGDGVHTEQMGDDFERWKESYGVWLEGTIDSPSMRKEMQLGISTMLAVMELKIAFPRNFHFLKGNHENVLNMEGDGDHGFRKFALEGQMVREFIETVYSDAMLHLIHCFELRLPIVALFKNFGVSHAEPARVYSREQIINYHDDDELILAFTWTGNGEAEEDSVSGIYKALIDSEPDRVLWFGGHRPVPERYLLRQDGHYVQFHNPYAMNVVVLCPGDDFDLEAGIVSVIEESSE